MVLRSGGRLALLMPKRKVPQPTKTPTKPAQVAVSFQAGYDRDFPTVYSNFAAITHTNHEFCIDFCLLAPAYQVDIENKVVIAPVIARVIIPPKLVEALREALRVELEKRSNEDPDRLLIPTQQRHK